MTDQAVTVDPRVTHCRSCGERIVFLPMPGSGKLNPANAETVEEGDTEFTWGRHVSHFATCPDAGEWRRPK